MGPIETAIKLKEELDTLRPISIEQELRIMQKFRLDWNYHSNNLEGNSLTYGETKALILFGLTAQGKPLKDHIEIEGHNEAIEWIIDVVKGEYPLTETFIRELHKLILKESYSVDAITPEGLPTKKKIEIGQYKTQPNHVLTNTGEIFRFASPEETPALMHDLMNWYHEKNDSANFNPILLAAEFHYKFIRIHPFDDGNGRTARILMNFILMQNNFPPVIIKTEEKRTYFSALRQADSGILEPFVNLIADNLVRSLEIMIRGARGESIEEPDDFDKELALLELKLTKTDQKAEKTIEILHSLYDTSVVPLITKFIEGGKKFEKFYVKSQHVVLSNGYASYNIEMAISTVKNNITLSTTEFEMSYSYNTFIHSQYGNFNFLSQVQVMLGPNTFIIKSNRRTTNLEKSYGEQLSESEIDEIVKHELKRHKDFIESKMRSK
ncbi:Fic family protein [Dyadobacter psychrotolerans]|uniref:Fic family protein n=1 Tax=Dyadobacter psychrotolerans TaxID=2541721 RepID=A0A4R5E148_9BACT|nr:Fic family protein [Dyadobacter psychrotolerans]TDE18351.1 Fic family protein [Dyadobacter psychrotolerans]